MIQRFMNEYVDDKNTFRTRRNTNSHLPTGVPADLCYYCPESYGGEEGITWIPEEFVDEMINTCYLDTEDLFRVSTPDFEWKMKRIMKSLGIKLQDMDLVSVWEAFVTILPILEEIEEMESSESSGSSSLGSE